MTAPLLEARRVVFSYSAAPLLENVSVGVEPGRVLGVAGPNGAGKTTLLNLLAGHLAPTRGAVTLGGRSLREIPRRSLAREIALIPPEVQAPFDYSVREVVEMGRYPYADAFRPLSDADREIVRAALARTGLAGFEDRIFNRISSGERQRTVIARALAQEPGVLLMDEPTVHLDLHYQIELHELLRSMAREDGRGVLLITHDLNLAARYCDTLLLMEQGRVVRQGTPEEVLDGELLSRVYRAKLEVHPHPRTGHPTVWPS